MPSVPEWELKLFSSNLLIIWWDISLVWFSYFLKIKSTKMLWFFCCTSTQRCVGVLVTQTGSCPSLTLVFITHNSVCTPCSRSFACAAFSDFLLWHKLRDATAPTHIHRGWTSGDFMSFPSWNVHTASCDTSVYTPVGKQICAWVNPGEVFYALCCVEQSWYWDLEGYKFIRLEFFSMERWVFNMWVHVQIITCAVFCKNYPTEVWHKICFPSARGNLGLKFQSSLCYLHQHNQQTPSWLSASKGVYYCLMSIEWKNCLVILQLCLFSPVEGDIQIEIFGL